MCQRLVQHSVRNVNNSVSECYTKSTSISVLHVCQDHHLMTIDGLVKIKFPARNFSCHKAERLQGPPIGLSCHVSIYRSSLALLEEYQYWSTACDGFRKIIAGCLQTGLQGVHSRRPSLHGTTVDRLLKGFPLGAKFSQILVSFSM